MNVLRFAPLALAAAALVPATNQCQAPVSDDCTQIETVIAQAATEDPSEERDARIANLEQERLAICPAAA